MDRIACLGLVIDGCVLLGSLLRTGNHNVLELARTLLSLTGKVDACRGDILFMIRIKANTG
jgi:hypothetical protein